MPVTDESKHPDFGGWEPSVEAVAVVRHYLIHQPEQGDWPWEDHCDGLAGGILAALHDAGLFGREPQPGDEVTPEWDDEFIRREEAAERADIGSQGSAKPPSDSVDIGRTEHPCP